MARWTVIAASLAKRLGRTLVLFAAIVVTLFFLMRILPGDVVDLLAIEGEMTDEMKQELRHELGLDRGPLVQFAVWFSEIARLDFGRSLRFHKPVVEIFNFSLPVTLRLAFLCSTIGIGLGILVATLAAIVRHRALEALVEAMNIWSIAMPTFCIGFILIFVVVLKMRLLPLSGNFVLPVAILSVDIAGSVAKPFFVEMKENLSSRFVTIARAKGLSHAAIIVRHVLPNSLTVLLALAGLIVAGTLNGSITMEVLFNLPGLGQMAYNAVSGRDYPLIQTLALFIAATVLVVNFVTDALTVLIDPRQRDRKEPA